MGENTNIEWCDHSWSPWRGCTKVSEGCAHCYAETLSKRNPAVLGEWGKGKPRVKAKNWNDPVKWDRDARLRSELNLEGSRTGRPTVFPSLCDPFDEEVPIEWLADFLQLIHDTPHLDWLLLTKRPELWATRLRQVIALPDGADRTLAIAWFNGTPPANVWLGTSVENQKWADQRIPELLKIPAKVRFLSVEPLLGPINTAWFIGRDGWTDGLGVDHVHWVIVGGESGPGARPCNVEWVRAIVRQCRAAGVPCFVKQLGAFVTSDNVNMDDWPDDTVLAGHGEGFAAARAILNHPKGGDPAEWPDGLLVREFPNR
jgi:protein gp37